MPHKIDLKPVETHLVSLNPPMSAWLISMFLKMLLRFDVIIWQQMSTHALMRTSTCVSKD